MQDRKGFIWIGTADGLNRYDGYTFHTFRHDPSNSHSLSNNTVWSLCEDREGIIWVGTVGGVHRYNPESPRFTRLADEEKYKGTVLEGLAYSIVADRRGNIWIAGLKGIAMFNPQSGALRQFTENEIPVLRARAVFRVLHEDEQGNVWLANGDGLFCCDDGRQQITRVPLPAKGVAFLASAKSSDGLYWFTTLYDGLWSYNPATGLWKMYRHDEADKTSLPGDGTHAVREDVEGRIWVGTISNGLSYLDRSRTKFYSYIMTDGLGKNARLEGVRSMMVDRSGLLWVGYDGGGLLKIDPHKPKFPHYLLPRSDTKASGDNFFKSIHADRDGNIWLGMYDQGVSVLNRTSGTVRRFRHNPSDPQSLCGNTVLALCEDQAKNMWIGTTSGVDEYQRSTDRIRHHDLPLTESSGTRAKLVTWLCEDSAGTMWCGTATGVLKYSNNRFISVFSLAALTSSPASTSVNIIVPANDGTLWVGTLGLGLLHLRQDGSLMRQCVHQGVNSLSHNCVKTILPDTNDVLWIGTEEGLNRYDTRKDEWKVYRMSDGLPNDFIYGVLMDEQRRLWISTNKGLSCFDTHTFEHPVFRNYTPDDGLQSYEFNTNVYCKAPNGELMFGGMNGFNAFFSDSVLDNRHVPSIVLTGFKKFDQRADVGSDIERRDVIELMHSESVFSFEFAALEFTNPARNKYAYRMEGFDPEWIDCGTRREARYTNLDPGEYIFRVRGSNNDAVWNEHGKSIRVVIVPPFWRTKWFLIVATLMGVALVAITVKHLSTRKLKKQIEKLEREKAIHEERSKTRERIARDLHDDLASTVGSASYFIESAKNSLKEMPPQAREFLDKTSSLLAEAEESMSDIVWSVSPHHDTLESLLSRMRLTTSDICRAANLKYEVCFPEIGGHYKLSEETRRGMYLIFKESITNAVKHACAHNIRVQARIEDSRLELIVADDGKGMLAEKVPTKRGHGLRNMKKRAEDIGAELSIQSIPDQGTSVLLSIRMTQTGH